MELWGQNMLFYSLFLALPLELSEYQIHHRYCMLTDDTHTQLKRTILHKNIRPTPSTTDEALKRIARQQSKTLNLKAGWMNLKT